MQNNRESWRNMGFPDMDGDGDVDLLDVMIFDDLMSDDDEDDSFSDDLDDDF